MENMEKSFEELYEESLRESKLEKTVTGKIITITDKGEIFVDIGYKADGIIPKSEYSDDDAKNPKDEFEIGDEITADVIKQNDGLGNVLLSYKRSIRREQSKELENRINNDEIFEEKIKEANDKGIIVELCGKRVFIPLSLAGSYRNENSNELKNKNIKFKVIEYDSKTNRIIGSVKVLEDEERRVAKEQFWSTVEVGKKYQGTVTSLSSYGAFVDIDGVVQGLLHISEITWERNAKVDDILKQGQVIEVIIKELDKENKRIKLSYGDKGENPWNKVKDKYNINDVVKVRINKLMPFGAFAELEPGIEGLIHISQISEKKIAKPEEELKENQHVNAKIIDMNLEDNRIELSIKELEGTSDEYKEEI